MKIRSISDVITNSSSEVFILSTTKSVSEVNNSLKKFTEGYKKPSRIKKGDEYTEYLVDFGYFVDLNDTWSVENYYIDYLTNYDKIDWSNYKRIPISEERVRYHELWINHIKNNLEYIRENYIKKYPNDSSRFSEFSEDLWITPDDLPEGFLKKFIEDNNIPDIPEEKKINSVIGKIGLLSVSDNTIPFYDFDKINEMFDGENYHLG